MEIFGDLSLFCHPTKKMDAKSICNAVDELNTPTFEKAPFDYDRQSHNSVGLLDVITSTDDPFNFKLKSQQQNISNINNIESNLMLQHDNISFMEGENIANVMPSDFNISTGETINYLTINPDISTNNIIASSSDMDMYNNPSDTVTPIYTNIINLEDEYLPTVHNCSDIFFDVTSNSEDLKNEIDDEFTNMSKKEYIVIKSEPVETHDLMQSTSKLNLALTIDNEFKNMNTLQTPDIIDIIDNSVKTGKEFDILNFIGEENTQTTEPSLTTLDIPIDTVPKSPSLAITKRKRKIIEDEDYIPPASFKSTKNKHVYESDDSSYTDSPTPNTRRRPSNNSILLVSPKDYSEDGGGKYREMRDKNNEASRKSRLKRKLKECAQEEESKQLEERNIKLKAKVAELERIVNNFRTNLMQILLKK